MDKAQDKCLLCYGFAVPMLFVLYQSTNIMCACFVSDIANVPGI
jgi:hypothetical protein